MKIVAAILVTFVLGCTARTRQSPNAALLKREEEVQCPGEDKTIPDYWICDDIVDCGSGWDESDEVCGEDYSYQCIESDKVIPADYFCDGYADCPYEEDESECDDGGDGTDEGFYCEGEDKVIPINWVCDGYADCESGLDEHPYYCGSENGTDSSNSTGTPYPEPEYHCEESNKTIPLEWVCDDYQDCEYGDDEWGCPTEYNGDEFLEFLENLIREIMNFLDM